MSGTNPSLPELEALDVLPADTIEGLVNDTKREVADLYARLKVARAAVAGQHRRATAQQAEAAFGERATRTAAAFLDDMMAAKRDKMAQLLAEARGRTTALLFDASTEAEAMLSAARAEVGSSLLARTVKLSVNGNGGAPPSFRDVRPAGGVDHLLGEEQEEDEEDEPVFDQASLWRWPEDGRAESLAAPAPISVAQRPDSGPPATENRAAVDVAAARRQVVRIGLIDAALPILAVLILLVVVMAWIG